MFGERIREIPMSDEERRKANLFLDAAMETLSHFTGQDQQIGIKALPVKPRRKLKTLSPDEFRQLRRTLRDAGGNPLEGLMSRLMT